MRTGLTQERLQGNFKEFDIKKGGKKTGFYADTAENRKKGLVGQKYSKDKEDKKKTGKKEVSQEWPKTFLSKKEDGTYSVIHEGIPLNKYGTKEESIAVAKKNSVDLSDRTWDAKEGKMVVEGAVSKEKPVKKEKEKEYFNESDKDVLDSLEGMEDKDIIFGATKEDIVSYINQEDSTHAWDADKGNKVEAAIDKATERVKHIKHLSPRAMGAFERSETVFNKRSSKDKAEGIMGIKEKLEMNKSGKDQIGMGLDEDMVAAGEAFLAVYDKK